MGGLVPLRQEHPKIQVQLVVSSAALDLVRRDADVALRLFRETNPALVTRKIGVVGWSVYASQAYLDRSGFVLKDDGPGLSFAGQAVVGYAGAAGRSPGALWLLEHCRAEDVVLTGESVPSVMNAVRAGIGLSVLPCFAAHGNASLVRLTPTVVAQTEAFLVIPPDHRNTVRVRLVMDAVTALFERERALLAGCVAWGGRGGRPRSRVFRPERGRPDPRRRARASAAASRLHPATARGGVAATAPAADRARRPRRRASPRNGVALARAGFGAGACGVTAAGGEGGGASRGAGRPRPAPPRAR